MQKVVDRPAPQRAWSVRRHSGRGDGPTVTIMGMTLGQNAREAVNSSSILDFFGRVAYLKSKLTMLQSMFRTSCAPKVEYRTRIGQWRARFDPECGPGCDGGAKSSILEGAGRYSDFLPVSGLPVFALNIWWALERVLVQWHCLFGLPASFFVVIETYWVLVLA